MKNILESNANILKILGKPHIDQNDVRLSRYCVQEQVDDGLLLFHTLTRELLLFSKEEAGQLLESDVLKERWFVVLSSIFRKFISEKMKLCAEARQWSGYAPLICSRASADGGVKGGEAVHLDP